MNSSFGIYKIRDALKHEGEYLSNLALRSKAIWGYDKEFIEACKPHIRVDEEYISNWPVVVAEFENKVVGFYSLKIISNEKRLDNLWIEPEFIRRGLGQLLFKDAVKRSQNLSWDYFRLAGEPDAIPFYEKMGARMIGEVKSRLRDDLFLPHMEFKMVSGNLSEREYFPK